MAKIIDKIAGVVFYGALVVAAVKLWGMAIALIIPVLGWWLMPLAIFLASRLWLSIRGKLRNNG